MRYDKWWVEVLRSALMWGLRIFYARIHVEGQDKVPRKGPVILASNHNNAVLDALLLGFYSGGRRPGFLTRADVFKHPWLRQFFTHLRMIPVFRMRDKVDIKTANQETFEQVAAWLARGQSAIIFPEGDKGHDFHLLPLKKGTARMAFHALSRLHEDLYIVPAGITYERMHLIRQRVVIRYGAPIRVQDYGDAYTRHPEMTLKLLTEELQKAIQHLMWHVPKRDVPLMHWWTDAQYARNNWPAQVEQAYTTISAMDEAHRLQWLQNIRHWRQQGVYPQSIGRGFPFFSLLIALLCTPLLLEGFTWLALPYFLPTWLAQRWSTHPHFHTSIRFGLLWACFPLCSILQGLLLAWLLPGVWAWLGLAVPLVIPVLMWQWYRAVRVLRWWLAWLQVPAAMRKEVLAAHAMLWKKD